ncbi:DUF423 domain-containing protein [Dasania marina]|uniref:DUF423 domain-containing protein n=1 Tax=Dasania marina TaxID=471499 RepID=UPI00035E7AEF|nr:DUF423 domain-containing protein [Dasania marina]
MAKIFLIVAALNGLLAVAIGAFGAHALKAKLTPDLMVVYQTAVQYHFYHLLALSVVGLLLLQWPTSRYLQCSGWLFIAGICLFTGSLYILALTGLRWLGAITPLGGLAFIAAWLSMALGLYHSQ